ncbi:MAG TPA: hypothetical protein VFH47_03215, partial [Candidatus Thermoplasmatota archaeon]|nr:hypothetical protein [Candidatus Thermoplasmatota archaeon]
FTAYDITDPAHPRHIGTVADPSGGCHMLEPVQVSETEDAVFCVASNLRSYLVERGAGRLVAQGFVDYLPSRSGAPTPGAVPVAGDPTCGLPVGCLFASPPHDVTVWHEEGAFGQGRSYAVVSHWDEGLKVVDVTDLPLMQEVGSWKGEGATHYGGNVHTAMVVETSAGRFIIASPEYTTSGTVPGLWVLRADEFGSLELVAEWYHPGQHDSQGLYLTTHQWQAAPRGKDVAPEDVRIYLTYNHAGVWVLDLGRILAGDHAAAVLGYNLARAPLDPDTTVPNAVLSTWDVNVVDGYVYGTDRATGLWVFHYAGDELGDERLTGYA